MLKIFFSVLVTASALTAQAKGSTSISGEVVYLMDGDTFVLLTNSRCTVKKDCRNGFKTYRVRLAYIDAPEFNKKKPELAQPYGFEATHALSQLIENKIVELIQTDVDRFGRITALIGVVAQIQFEANYPKPQPWLCHGCRLRTAQFSKSIQDGCTNMQFVHLAFKGP